MYKKAGRTCKVVVLLIKPIHFSTFSLPAVAVVGSKGPVYIQLSERKDIGVESTKLLDYREEFSAS